MNRPSGRMALEFSDVSKSYGEHQVIDGFSATGQPVGSKTLVVRGPRRPLAVVHLANHDVTLSAVSRAPLA